MLARLAGQDDDGGFRLQLQQLPQPVQPLGVRQAEVEQHASRAGYQVLGLDQGACAPDDDRGSDLAEQLADEHGVAVVVFYKQDLDLIVAGGRGRGLEFSVTCHRNLHRGLGWVIGGLASVREQISTFAGYHHACSAGPHCAALMP